MINNTVLAMQSLAVTHALSPSAAPNRNILYGIHSVCDVCLAEYEATHAKLGQPDNVRLFYTVAVRPVSKCVQPSACVH